ncbi:MAG: pyruvate formate lyase family protein [Lentisphaeria bacterium]
MNGYERIWPMLRTLRRELEREFPAAAGVSVPEREALLFAETLKRIPVGRSGRTTLFGEMGLAFVAGAERAAWEQRLRAAEDAAAAAPTSSAPDAFQEMDRCFGFLCSDGGGAHTTVDYGTVVAHGLKGVVARIDRELPGAAPAKRDLLAGMQTALRALAEFARRYDPASRVPWEPAATFAEGLQTLWLVTVGIAVSEQAPWSISLGRVDQYLFDRYRADRAAGVPETVLAAQLADFFRMLDNPEFADAAVALNLGGRDAAGRSQFNELSRLVVTVAAELRLPAPLLAVHVDDTLAPEDFDRLCVPELLTVGQPTFYGEDACRRALACRGVPAAELPEWAANSCMGLMMPGREWADMWGSVIILPVALELALNGGHPFNGELPLPLATVPPAAYRDFAELFDTVCAYADELTGVYIAETERRRALRLPNPFVSALLDDCMERGLDRLHGGVRYRTLTVETFGLVNCADALLAVKRLVFDTAEFSLAALTAAAKNDYADAAALLQRVKNQPKYGNADAEADGMLAALAARVANSIIGRSTPEVACAPSLHTLTGNVDRGARTAASLDGRRRGEPLAKNAGTRPGIAAAGHTSLLLSASAFNQAEFFGGQPVDLSLDPALFATPEGRRRFQALVRTYFQRGGLQLQVNGLSPERLRQAMREPERHHDLIVRIGGFSMRFTSLSREVQQDMVARFETGV